MMHRGEDTCKPRGAVARVKPESSAHRFIGPYAARTAMWLTVNRSQALMEAESAKLVAAAHGVAEAVRESDLAGARIVSDALDDLSLRLG